MHAHDGSRAACEQPGRRQRLEWLAARGLVRLLGLLPSSWLLLAARCAARVAGRLARRRRRTVERQVAERLGHAPGSPASRRVVRGAFRTLLLNLVDPLLLERALDDGRPLEQLVDIEGARHLESALASGRGVIVATGHLGAWECLLIVLHRRFGPTWIVSRRLRNPLLDQLLWERRRRWAAGRLSKDGCGRRMARLLREGACFGLALDQNAGRQGVLLDFLGAPASHHDVAGIMAARTGALVVPAYLLREPGTLRLRLLVEPPLEAPTGVAPPQAALQVTRRLSDSLERQVRRHPEQWLWLHERWRRAERLRPPAQPAAAARPMAGPAVRTG